MLTKTKSLLAETYDRVMALRRKHAREESRREAIKLEPRWLAVEEHIRAAQALIDEHRRWQAARLATVSDCAPALDAATAELYALMVDEGIATHGAAALTYRNASHVDKEKLFALLGENHAAFSELATVTQAALRAYARAEGKGYLLGAIETAAEPAGVKFAV